MNLGNFTMMSFHWKAQVRILILRGIQSINFVFQMEMRKKDGMLVDEKNARMKVEQTLLNCMERLVETEERLKRVESSSR